MKKTLITSLKCALLFSSFIAVGHTMQSRYTPDDYKQTNHYSHLYGKGNRIITSGIDHPKYGHHLVAHSAGLTAGKERDDFWKHYLKDPEAIHAEIDQRLSSQQRRFGEEELDEEGFIDPPANLSRQTSRVGGPVRSSSFRTTPVLQTQTSFSRGGLRDDFEQQREPRAEKLRQAQQLIGQAQGLIEEVLREQEGGY